VNTVMKLRVPQNVGNFFSSGVAGGFSIRTLHRGVGFGMRLCALSGGRMLEQ
jgi:hypothetical protein